MSASDPRSRLFPPIFMIVGVLIGVGLQAIRPLPFVPRTAGQWIGGCLIGAALALGVWAVLTFRRAGTTPDPHGDVTAFVITGPFAFSRNPMYVTNVAFQIGAALVLDNAWIFILAPVTWLLLDRVIIAGEERYLVEKYGATYDAYRHAVRRWL
ncbi:MAG TPA: isoprenylcysteine carboxylmethyltransferase family protein [Gemmatimonadales bacterium]|nr:isoprenylcysteine carboxylmethyltransferase family protein [Gemmatimonadales bacterium]